MGYDLAKDRLVTQRQLAAGLGISEEHLSRTLRSIRESGGQLPPHGTHPETGFTGWYLAAFAHWWHRRRQQPPPRILTREGLHVALAQRLDDRAIADEYDLSIRTVHATAEAYGMRVPRRADVRRDRCVQLAARGLKPWQIAGIVGCGERTVYTYLQQARQAQD